MLRRTAIALALLVGLNFSAVGQDKDKDKKTDPGKPVELKWKFEKDKTFYQELTTTTQQDMKVMGMDVKQKQTQTFYFSWTPLEQKEKDWVIEQKIEGVKMDIQIGGNTISYDSESPNQQNNPLAEFFKALKGSKFKLTIGPDMRVSKVEGRKEFLDKLVAANQQMKPLLEQILSEDALKQMADPTFAIVPNKEVKKDDTWQFKTKLNLGPIGSYDTEYTYKYLGPENQLEKIGATANLKYVPPPAEAGAGGLPFRIKDAKLESKNANGTAFYDPKTGRIDNYKMSLTLEGTLDIEIGGMTSKVELKQTQETVVKTSSENPLAKKSGS
jgi:hypothetical protein